MVYINSDGTVRENRSYLRLSLITDIFFGIANFIQLFITSLINPKKPLPKGPGKIGGNGNNKSNYSGGGGGGGGGGGNRPRGPNIHQLKDTNNNCSTGG